MKSKNLPLWALLAVSLSFLLFSCVKTGAGTTATGATDSSVVFSATIAGTAWTADSVTAVLVNGRDSADKWITINGFSSAKLITISLHDTAMSKSTDSSMTVGQYVVDSWPESASFGYAAGKILVGHDSVWNQSGVSKSGQAAVTASVAATKKISGTFNFTARVISFDSVGLHQDTVVVTNGVFKNIPYTVKHHH